MTVGMAPQMIVAEWDSDVHRIVTSLLPKEQSIRQLQYTVVITHTLSKAPKFDDPIDDNEFQDFKEKLNATHQTTGNVRDILMILPLHSLSVSSLSIINMQGIILKTKIHQSVLTYHNVVGITSCLGFWNSLIGLRQ